MVWFEVPDRGQELEVSPFVPQAGEGRRGQTSTRFRPLMTARFAPVLRLGRGLHPLREVTSAPAPTAPLVALVDYVSGFPCLWVTPFAFYGEKTATLLQALDRCLQTGQLDEVECCPLHALKPGRGLVFDWLVDLGFAHSEDGHWLVWRSPRLT